jgi:hypothetical protein
LRWIFRASRRQALSDLGCSRFGLKSWPYRLIVGSVRGPLIETVPYDVAEAVIR